MPRLPEPCESHTLGASTGAQDFGARLFEILACIGDADTTDSALGLFKEAVIALGADAGVFMSHLRDDATRTSLRSLWACDPVWAAEYASHNWFEHDPWLRHATHDAEPIRLSALKLTSAEEEAFVAAASIYGFRSAVIAPAPSHIGRSRVGVLCIGSQYPEFFEGEAFSRERVWVRALAMELHRWLLQSMRQELLLKSRITEAEIELLRHEEAGHSSKVIGAALNVEGKTIDCRFQRLNAKLEAPDRRTALRIAKLYGLL
ncbi:Autoinducer binding domain protein [Hydrogenophaga sp. T4]|nr:Autoinducer binding domain protein [Hydrogenophaga sp. T4]